jgi:hypothetical protein
LPGQLNQDQVAKPGIATEDFSAFDLALQCDAKAQP